MTISYTVSGVTRNNTNFIDFDLRYGAITTAGQRVLYTGSNFIDAVFVRPGMVYDLTTGDQNDKIYLTGNLVDYAMRVDGNKLTLERIVGGQIESVTLLGGGRLTTSFDSLIFANGVVSSSALFSAVQKKTPLPPVATTETSLAPEGAAAPNAPLSGIVTATASSTTGEVFATVKPGIKLVVKGSGGVDTVYVADGMNVDATQLGGNDKVYMRGKWSEYAKTLNTRDGTITFTRTVDVEGKKFTETVVVSRSINNKWDRLFFADGGVDTDFAYEALQTSLRAPITAVTGYDADKTTPLYSDSQVAAALLKIANYADKSTNPVPTLEDYTAAGVSGVGGVDQPTVAMVNSALADTDITKVKADERAKVQAIVKAYQAILAEANDRNANAGDSTPDATTADPTAVQYAGIGASIGLAATDVHNLALLNDIVGASQASDVDSVAKIEALAAIANAIQATAADQPSTLTTPQLSQIGLSGVNENNLAAVRAAIAAQNNDGSATDSLAKLQALVNNPNVKPVLTQSDATALVYTENQASTAVVPKLTVLDADSATLASASVSLSGFVSGQDVLRFVNAPTTMGNIAGSFNATTGVLSLSSAAASATPAQWQAALRAVGYSNTSDAPNTSVRTLSVVVNDGKDSSAAVTRQIQINAVNDAPTLSATLSRAPYANTAAAQALFSNATLRTVDSGQTIKGLKFTVTNLDGSTNERIRVDGTEFNLVNATCGTTSANSVGFSVAVTGSTATVTLTSSAGLSTAQAKVLVEGIAYKHAVAGGMARDHVVTLTQVTDSGSNNNIQNLNLSSTLQDKTAPAAVDLSSATAGVQATQKQFYNSANAGKAQAIVGNVAQSRDTDIALINVAVGGVGDAANDKLMLGTSTVNLNTAAQSACNVTVDAVTGVNWSYSAVKVLTLSKNDGGTFTAVQVQQIEQGLQFQTTGAVQGARTFAISHTDSNANAGPGATQTVTVDTVAPTLTISDNTCGTARGVVKYTFDFNDDVGSSFTAADITASGGATISNFTKEHSTRYTADITPPFGSGTMSVDVTTGSFKDNAGNVNTTDTTANSQPYSTSRAGESVITLGTSNGINMGQLILGTQLNNNGNWYYHLDKDSSGDSHGVDYMSMDSLAVAAFGTGYTGAAFTENNRSFTINGVGLRLITDGNQASTKQWQTAIEGGTFDPNAPGTNYADANGGINGYYAKGTSGNTAYTDALGLWDQVNTGTSSGEYGGTANDGTPSGWINSVYLTATPSLKGHAAISLCVGYLPSLPDSHSFYVALQVLPIVIDLNRDGALSYGNVVMDVNGDGLLDATRWAGAQDGVLVWDKFHDGQVHDHSQYAFAQYDTTSKALGKTATDLSGLADAFDSNHDGVFDARDAQFADFSVWQDANQNGVSDAGEVRTLAELGLASFNLSSDGVARTPVAGVFEAGQTSATTTDGTQVLVADVGFDFTTLPVMDMSADPAGNTLALQLSDLLASPAQTLVVKGAANDSVMLAGDGWTNTGAVATQNGHTYAVWHNNTAQALIDQQVMTAGYVVHA